MKNIDIKGIIATIIALTFGIILVTTVVGVVVTGRALSDATTNLLSTICGALIGVLSTYIGGKVSETKPPEQSVN